MHLISLFVIISIVLLCEAESVVCLPDAKIFLCIPSSAANAATVNPKGIKTLLASGLTTCFINGNPAFSNRPRSLPRNPPDCIILDSWVFDK